jgi:hypothetical protein
MREQVREQGPFIMCICFHAAGRKDRGALSFGDVALKARRYEVVVGYIPADLDHDDVGRS